MRIHPAASRVRKLSREHPALYIVFDLLVDERGKSLVERTGKRAHTVTRTLEKLLAKPRSPAARRAGRAAGTPRAAASGNRLRPRCSSKCSTISFSMHGLRTARQECTDQRDDN
jgi:hypothetical protein